MQGYIDSNYNSKEATAVGNVLQMMQYTVHFPPCTSPPASA